jgi:hypothetical protein
VEAPHVGSALVVELFGWAAAPLQWAFEQGIVWLMLRRQIQILDQAREALQERWQVVEAAEQAGIQLEVDRVVGASLVLAVLSGTADVL